MQSDRIYKFAYGWEGEDGAVANIQGLDSLKLSIVIPTLNQADTIRDTFMSIIQQDYQNIELIVMDGGSTDGTISIIEEFQEFIAYFESGNDGGQSSAINKGFEKASGDIYAWINSDDYYLPQAFSKVVNTFLMDESVDIVVGSGQVLTKDCKFLKQIKSIEMSRENLLGWNNDQWIMQQCCFWTARIWEKCGGVDKELQLLMDYDLWLRFSDIGKSARIESNLAVMRYYNQTKTISLRKRMSEEEAYVYAKNKAYDKLKSLVYELRNENENIMQELERINGKKIVRILRRCRVL